MLQPPPTTPPASDAHWGAPTPASSTSTPSSSSTSAPRAGTTGTIPPTKKPPTTPKSNSTGPGANPTARLPPWSHQSNLRVKLSPTTPPNSSAVPTTGTPQQRAGKASLMSKGNQHRPKEWAISLHPQDHHLKIKLDPHKVWSCPFSTKGAAGWQRPPPAYNQHFFFAYPTSLILSRLRAGPHEVAASSVSLITSTLLIRIPPRFSSSLTTSPESIELHREAPPSWLRDP